MGSDEVASDWSCELIYQMKKDIARVDREKVARILLEFHIDCYMILLPSAKGGDAPSCLWPVGRIRNTKIMSLAAIDVIAGDLSRTPRRIARMPSSAPRQIPGVTIFHDCLSQIIPKSPARWKLQKRHAYFRLYNYYRTKKIVKLRGRIIFRLFSMIR